jgi:hypothetical protein
MKARLLGETKTDKAVHHLYEMTPPVPRPSECLTCGHATSREVRHVVVSAATINGRPETYIFEASPDGQILDWTEMGGSFQGGLDHAEALRNAGYEVLAQS